MAQPVCDVLVNGANNVSTHRYISIIHTSASSGESQQTAHQTSRRSSEISIYYTQHSRRLKSQYCKVSLPFCTTLHSVGYAVGFALSTDSSLESRESISVATEWWYAAGVK